MNDVEAKAELVQFARDEHNKLQTCILGLEEAAAYNEAEIVMLKLRIDKAKAILKQNGMAYKGGPNVQMRHVLEALDGK